MGQRGPPPKPAELKKAQGTYKPGREAAREASVVPPGEPPMPENMPEVAERRWREVAPELLKLKTLAVIDGGALEAYCRAYARWSVMENVAFTIPTVETPFGPKINPAAAEARKLHKEVIQPLELALGLHYAARSRVSMPVQKSDDPVAKFLFEGGSLTAIPGGKGST